MKLNVVVFSVSIILYYYLLCSFCANLKVNVKLDKISSNRFPNDASNSIIDVEQNKRTVKTPKFKYPTKCNMETINEIDIQKRPAVFDQMAKAGKFKLESLGAIYKTHLNPDLNITITLQNVTDKYKAALATYYNVMGKQVVKSRIDRKFQWFYIIETANHIFHADAKILLNNINAQVNNSASEIDFIMLTEEIENAVVEEKKGNIKYICEKLEICRVFPSYSDRVVELMSEILKLSDPNFQVIAKLLEETVAIKASFFNYVIDVDIMYRINYTLKSFCESVRTKREILLILRKIITERYKIYKSNEDETKPITMAVKILIELIDKMFEIEGEDINEIKFDNVIESVKAWQQGNRQEADMRKLFYEFSNNFMDVFKFHLDEATMEELNVLLELLVMGNSDKSIVLDNLFAEGSTFVRRAGDFSGLNDLI